MAKGYLYDNGDELITREDVNEVPDSSTAHAGDVLELDSNKKPKWTTPESGLPDTSDASVGDVLTHDSDKDPVWSTPSGGGGGSLPITIDFTATPVSVPLADGSGNGNGYPANVTYSDIVNAIEEGKYPFIHVDDDGEYGVFPLFSLTPNDGDSPYTGYAHSAYFFIGNTISASYTLYATSENGTMYYVNIQM